ncbi:Maf family nucleotide pyrophosphatase [Flavobacteriales bacterium DA487]
MSDKKLVLASKSPRRQKLLREMDLMFETRVREIDEKFPSELKREEIPMFLSELKAGAFKDELNPQEILITSDTVVCLGDRVMNKPENRKEAIEMLSSLSGKMHTVYTAVTLTSSEKQITFSDATDVYFKELTAAEIEYYIDQHRPFDKAGAYGIQEWIGYIGIEKIEGSYFTVVGLPVQKLYAELSKF